MVWAEPYVVLARVTAVDVCVPDQACIFWRRGHSGDVSKKGFSREAAARKRLSEWEGCRLAEARAFWRKDGARRIAQADARAVPWAVALLWTFGGAVGSMHGRDRIKAACGR